MIHVYTFHVRVSSCSPETYTGAWQTLAFEITVRVSGHNIGCSRGRGSGDGLETTDVVAPSCSQLLRLDTQVIEEGGYSYQINTQYRAVSTLGGSSSPPVDPHGLHAPFPSFS